MKRKIISYFMIIIFLTLSLVMVGFGVAATYYYYQSIANTFQQQAESVSPVWARETDFSGIKLMDYSDDIIKQYEVKGSQLQLLKRDGKLIQSSTGFNEGTTYYVDPSVLTLKTVYKTEKNKYSGEKIMAVYTPLIFEGQTVGVLRYVISLTKIDSMIMHLIGIGIIICVVVAVIVLLVSLKLGNSIVRPLNDIIDFTKKMPDNKYRKRIKKIYPNEIGEMAKMLNYMADEILKTDRFKNDFISSVTHELRTPLTGIKGWIETIQAPHDLSDEELKFGLGIIGSESERLIVLVEDLLDFSRYQSNRIELVTASVNVDKIINEVIFTLKQKSEKKGIRLVAQTIPITITADGNKLKQVVFNILDNAINFSYKDSIINIIQTINQDSVLIQIINVGIGIKKENLEHIMKSFYKIDPKSAGSGLGLAISRSIVDNHGGTLQIESEYGKGTTVNISLPLEGIAVLHQSFE
ncbi:HAMP domain-containing sensor histidine kinase [Clostridium estertheticum]|uniref:HAMP domain-containing sensor histidine kinase n=1 Tax=Clostridium estertheticum TaxID=238834 RepID=UPI001C7DD870|nr:HAMP domain-containing sensor histidine kinase [Clostridium estertheticum]MBX4270493.1 HAMP domain-containing histidine kinase [Clostridium estertheticum]WLC81263.1 HAMP domain-containing histidine kinase [Clostridium estertheticum]